MEAGPVSGAVVGRVCPQPQRAAASGQSGVQSVGVAQRKSQGGRIVLRIEDLDAERCPRIYADLLEEDLRWLGLVWDEGGSRGGPNGPLLPERVRRYLHRAVQKLEAQGLVYPCFCSRAQLHAASAPHASDGNVIYPGTCRDLTARPDRRKAEKERPRPTGCGCRTRRSPFWMAAWAPTPENLLRDCGDFTCAGRTACSPTSWPWWWTMPAWALPKWCAVQTCFRLQHGSCICTACWD